MLQQRHPENQLPLTRIQRLIGTYMLQSKRTKPSAYIRMRADLTELAALRAGDRPALAACFEPGSRWRQALKAQ